MEATTPAPGSKDPAGKANRTVITDARSGASQELATRQKRYAITMAFRTACFISMIFVPGVFRWILFAGAVFLPYVAVVLANQAHTKTMPNTVVQGVPTGHREIGTAEANGEVIDGMIVDGPGKDGDQPVDGARPGGGRQGDGSRTRHDRVA